MDRFDLTADFRTFLDLAISHKVADASDIFALAVTHAGDMKATVDEITVYAHNNRHSATGMDTFRAIVKAGDKALNI